MLGDMDPQPASSMSTVSGRVIDLASAMVDPSVIHLDDIAGGLSRICRFAGQTTIFYSVAQHAVLVSNIVEIDFERRDLALEALHHDSHEAYLGDIPTPLRRAMTEMENWERKNREKRFDVAIYVAFGIVPATDRDAHALMKAADRTALLIEASALLYDRGETIRRSFQTEGVAAPISDREVGPSLLPEDAEERFRETHHRLASG
jgi:hypothetical protein